MIDSIAEMHDSTELAPLGKITQICELDNSREYTIGELNRMIRRALKGSTDRTVTLRIEDNKLVVEAYESYYCKTRKKNK